MIVSIASMKGGVGKSTIASMLAKYVADTLEIPVTVVDMDPQRGATIILLGPQKTSSLNSCTIYDVLESELENIPSQEILSQAFVPSSYHDSVRVIPASAALGRIAGPDTPRDLLRLALSDYQYDISSLMIIDTGPDITLCEMSIAASDLVFIPITLSHQTGVPTLNTLQAAFKYESPVGGLIPTMVGASNWSDERIDEWRESLLNTQLVKSRKIVILPSMPYSQAAIRGTWRWGKIPEVFMPMLKSLTSHIFDVFDPMDGIELKVTKSSINVIEGTV